MKYRILSSISALALSLGLLSAFPVSAAQSLPVTLTSKDSAYSAVDALVAFNDGNATAVVAENGEFTLPALKDGTYKMSVQARSFVEREYDVTFKEGSIVSPPEIRLSLIGDISGDGAVNASDLLLLKSHIKGVSTLDDYKFKCADVDNSGDLKATDLLKIKAHIKGVSPLFNKPVTSAHTHNWQPVTTQIYHEAEYATKTIWMYNPQFYYGGHPENCPWGPNRLTPDRDPDGWWQRRTSYDLLCWHYGSLEDVPDEYKVWWITKDNCTDYGISYDKWCNLPSYGYDAHKGCYIATTDYWGNVTEFNPEYDVLVGIKATAQSKAEKEYKKQFGVSFSVGCNSINNCYMPVAQETICIKDAWTEPKIVARMCTACGKIELV